MLKNLLRPKLKVQEKGDPDQAKGLNAFGGVFTPSILTILGVIMYLRFGWVVANVGLWGSLAIVTISTSITFLTGLSISQIATDQRVRVGGAYYMISRSLGIEAGGAIGLPLYFAQALSVALYTIGFAESLALVFPALEPRTIGLVTTVLVTLLALISAKTAIRAQYIIMVAIGLSLVSLAFGRPLSESLVAEPMPLEKASFWTVLAVFFPAVTGIMAGVNMSGDLKDPRRAIPLGTLASIGVSYVIYMLIPVLLVSRADPASLMADPLIMRHISFWGGAILLGVWGATLSSALGSILGAPRILQALARDGILPKSLAFLGRGNGPDDEPRIGTVVTMLLALIAVALADLNLIAPVLSMFFLTTYGVVNVVAGLERFLGSPSFRPTFKVPWFVSLLGAVGCVAIMILINWLATLVAVVVVLLIYVWLERRELKTTWGDVRQGVWMAVVRNGLLHLRAETDPKNWQPNLLVLSGLPGRRWHLVDFAASLSHNRAILSVATVLTGEGATLTRRQSAEESLREALADKGIEAFPKIIKADDIFEGARQLIDIYGMGALTPNTVVLGHSENPAHLEPFGQLVRYCNQMKRNVLIVRPAEEPFGQRKIIDLWWGGLKGNGGLMMTLAYLLSLSLNWRGARVRIKMMVTDEAAAKVAQKNLRELMNKLRIAADIEALSPQGQSFESLLRASSSDADVIFLGMKEPGDDFSSYYADLSSRTAGLPTTVFVRAAEALEFSDILA
ncbi:MAG: amino acid permease [Trueperaceae bacterium]|nr:amino acid permease [Trueperaceae bacterium]